MAMSSRPSMESVKERKTESRSKLWTDVKPQLSRSNVSLIPSSRESFIYPSGLNSPRFVLPSNQRPVKPTLTTLLRQNQLLAKDARKEKEKVDSFLQGSSGLDYEDWKYRKEYEAKKETETREAKRILQAKLAYHKAKAAAQNVLSTKYENASVLKRERQQLKKEVVTAMREENDRKRAQVAEIHDDFQHTKQLIEEVKEAKRKQAEEIKQQTMKLQDESRWKEQQLFKAKREKIKQIQAEKVAAKISKKKFSTAAFMTDIGSPDADILMKLAKESQKAQLEEKRRKVFQAKDERQRKLRDLERKMEIVNQRSYDQRRLHARAISTDLAFPSKFRDTFVDDQELLSLQKELQKFKVKTSSIPNKNPMLIPQPILTNYKHNQHKSARWPYIRKP